MSLWDEIQEAKRIWEKASWPIRGFIALSLFLNFGAIASLSDVVFALKGALGILQRHGRRTTPLPCIVRKT